MKNQQTIHKIRLLQKIKPLSADLKRIKRRIDLQMQQNSSKIKPPVSISLGEIISATTYGLTLGALSLSILLFVLSFISPIVHNAVLFSKIALANNQYKKAQIAFESIQTTFNNEKQSYDKKDIQLTLALTNQQLTRLALKGEKGKYTQEQCLSLYREYLHFLQTKQTAKTFQEVGFQMHLYEEKAEQRLQMYPTM